MLGWLLVTQTLVHLADAAAEVAVGYSSAAAAAIGTGALCALAALWLFRHADGPPVLRPSAIPAATGH